MRVVRIEDHVIRDSKTAGMFLVHVHGKMTRSNTFESVTGAQRQVPQGRAVKWQNGTAGLELERELATLMNHESLQIFSAHIEAHAVMPGGKWGKGATA